jgi:hypothetical protein
MVSSVKLIVCTTFVSILFLAISSIDVETLEISEWQRLGARNLSKLSFSGRKEALSKYAERHVGYNKA